MEKQEIVNKTDKPNSFEFGKTGNRFKIYFNSPEDLDKTIKDLKELGYNVEDVK